MTIKEYKEHCKNGNIAMRSCWKCNKAHEHLKKADYIIFCFDCGNTYYKGKLLKIKKEPNK